MLKIQVLGTGLIPRGLGLAPRKDPFPADKTLIGTIMSTAGLTVNMINPETNRPVPLNAQNLQRMWNTYANYKPNKSAPVNQTGPAIPVDRNPAHVVTPPVPHSPVNINASQVGLANISSPGTPTPVVPEKPVTPTAPEVKNETPTEKKDESAASDIKSEPEVKSNDQKPGYVIKPINNDDKQRNGNNNNHK